MLFAVTPVVTVFCLLPFPPPTRNPPSQKNRRVWGFDWGVEGASPAESDICLQGSGSKASGLHASDFLNERVEKHSCKELQRLRKAKFSSPKPPRASGKPSGFMKRALVRAGAAAWWRPWLPRGRVVSRKAGAGCSGVLAFLVVLVVVSLAYKVGSKPSCEAAVFASPAVV